MLFFLFFCILYFLCFFLYQILHTFCAFFPPRMHTLHIFYTFFPRSSWCTPHIPCASECGTDGLEWPGRRSWLGVEFSGALLSPCRERDRGPPACWRTCAL